MVIFHSYVSLPEGNWIWFSSMTQQQQFSHWISGFAVSPVVRHIDCYRNHRLTIQGWGWTWWNLSIGTAHYPNYQLWGLPQSRSGHHRIHSCSFSPFSAATVSARTYLRGRRLRGILTGLYFWTMQFFGRGFIALANGYVVPNSPKIGF